MLSVIFLPRQFQVMVVENVDERHLQARRLGLSAVPAADQPVRAADRARRPAALRRRRAPTPRPSCCRCRWPPAQPALALLAFIGGLSAATGMIIVEAIAVSTMVCNDLVMPLLLRTPRLRRAPRPARLLLAIRRARDRRGAAARLPVLPRRRRSLRAGQHRADQLRRGGAVRAGAVRRHVLEGRHAPRRAGRAGGRLRAVGLDADAAVDRQVGLARRRASSTHGPFGMALLRPEQLFGLDRPGQPDALRCSGACSSTSALYVGVSLWRAAVSREASQALLFVDVFAATRATAGRDAAGVLARPGHGWPTCARWPRASSAPTRARPAVRRRTRDRTRRWPTRRSGSAPTRSWCSSSRRSWPARSAAPRRASMVASVVEEEALGARRRDAHPRRDLAAARAIRGRWRRSRARWSAPAPN